MMNNNSIRSLVYLVAALIIGLLVAVSTNSSYSQTSTVCLNNLEALEFAMKNSPSYSKNSMYFNIGDPTDVALVNAALVSKYGPPPVEQFGPVDAITKVGFLIFDPSKTVLVFYNADECSYDRSLNIDTQNMLTLLNELNLYDKYLSPESFTTVEEFVHRLGGKVDTF